MELTCKRSEEEGLAALLDSKIFNKKTLKSEIESCGPSILEWLDDFAALSHGLSKVDVRVAAVTLFFCSRNFKIDSNSGHTNKVTKEWYDKLPRNDFYFSFFMSHELISKRYQVHSYLDEDKINVWLKEENKHFGIIAMVPDEYFEELMRSYLEARSDEYKKKIAYNRFYKVEKCMENCFSLALDSIFEEENANKGFVPWLEEGIENHVFTNGQEGLTAVENYYKEVGMKNVEEDVEGMEDC